MKKYIHSVKDGKRRFRFNCSSIGTPVWERRSGIQLAADLSTKAFNRANAICMRVTSGGGLWRKRR